jgi:O-antigen ligase
MTDAIALDAPREDRLELYGAVAIMGVAAMLEFSIAIAQVLVAVAAICWIATLVVRHERVEVPRFFWPLAAYAGMTLVSAAFSIDPRAGLIGPGKQLVLFLLVPITCRFATGSRRMTLMTVVLTSAAISAAFGVFQYAVLHYDFLGMRPRGTLGHWMTFSGLLMLAASIAVARVLFGRGERTWAALVLPALAVGVAVTFTRSAEVGILAAVALLFSLKDFRLFAVLPIVAAVFIAAAPGQITQRFVSMFNKKDVTRIDRVAMLREGGRMVAAHPLVGVGPNMVQRRYAEYRGDDAVNQTNPHLHDNPVQIAAERGLPAVALWFWFLATLVHDLWRRFRTGTDRFLPAAALAVVTAMFTAGLFEYNFGDSEFLMLFLIVVSLPFAFDRAADARV